MFGVLEDHGRAQDWQRLSCWHGQLVKSTRKRLRRVRPSSPLSRRRAETPEAELPRLIESLLFVASSPTPVGQLAEVLRVDVASIEQALRGLAASFIAERRGLALQRKGDQVQLTTVPEAAPHIERFLGLDLTTRLSQAALESLAMIAYRQPVTRAQIEAIRGVNCDGVLRTLLARGLVEPVGRLEQAGGRSCTARPSSSCSISAWTVWNSFHRFRSR